MNEEKLLKHINERIKACEGIVLDAKISIGELKVIKEMIENE